MKPAFNVLLRTAILLIIFVTGSAGANEDSAQDFGDSFVEALGNSSAQDFGEGPYPEFDDGSAHDFNGDVLQDFSYVSAPPSRDGSAQDFSDGYVEDINDGSTQAFNDGTVKKLLGEILTDKEKSTELTVRGIDIVMFLRGLISGVQSWAENLWSSISTSMNSPEEIWRHWKLFSDSMNLFPARRKKRGASDSKCKRGTKATVCGVAPPRSGEGHHQRSKRVVNGTTSRQGQWPWMVSIYVKDRFDKVFNACGGVLIARDIVMSASHCFTDTEKKWTANVDQLYVRLGSNRNPLDQYIDPDEGAIISNVRKAVFHPEFDSRTFNHDIALFLLDNPEVYRRNFMPICLPNSNENDRVGETGVVAGWGLLRFSGSLPPLLQETDVQILSREQCDDWYRNRTSSVLATKAFLCAGYMEGFKDACTGDSGGPLMIQDNRGRWTTFGIVSHGYKCAQLLSPGFYVNVTSYRPWIDETKMQLYKLRQKDL